MSTSTLNTVTLTGKLARDVGYNGVRSQLETNGYLRDRVDYLLDHGNSYREIQRITGVGYRAVCRYAMRRAVPLPVLPSAKSVIELRLEQDFKAFERIQTKSNYDRYHATLREYEQERWKHDGLG